MPMCRTSGGARPRTVERRAPPTHEMQGCGAVHARVDSGAQREGCSSRGDAEARACAMPNGAEAVSRRQADDDMVGGIGAVEVTGRRREEKRPKRGCFFLRGEAMA